MSSDKIYTTVGIDREVYERLLKEVQADQRSRGHIVTQALRILFNMIPAKEGAENVQ